MTHVLNAAEFRGVNIGELTQSVDVISFVQILLIILNNDDLHRRGLFCGDEYKIPGIACGGHTTDSDLQVWIHETCIDLQERVESQHISLPHIIARHFMEMAQFIDSALSENGKVFVNCVFGRSRSTSLSCSPSSRSSTCSSSTCSRSTSCVVAYLMLKHDWTALKALTHIREKRPIQVIIMVKRTRVYSCTLFRFINWFLHFPPLAVLFLLWLCVQWESLWIQFQDTIWQFRLASRISEDVKQIWEISEFWKERDSDNQDIDITRKDRRDNKTLGFERSDVKSNIWLKKMIEMGGKAKR